jgi:cold shock protein
MTNVIAIYGKTCTEKSEIARELSRLTGNKVKHPGEAITTRAKVMKLDSGSKVPEQWHDAVDEDARAWVAGSGEDLIIVDSALLDAVVGPREGVFYVHVHARDEVRERRWDHRREQGGGRTRQIGEGIAQRDRDDAELRARRYASAPVIEPDLSIDSSDRTPLECAVDILSAFQVQTGVEYVSLGQVEMDKSARRGIRPGPSTGVVKSYQPSRTPFGGYLTDDTSGQDLYVHKSAVKAAGIGALEPGQAVTYEVVEDGFGGFKATNLALAG